jgi:hypothetical protein
MIEFDEKRAFSRTRTNCGMSFKRVGADDSNEGLCLDISGSGILFQADCAIEPGRALEIHTRPKDRITPPITAFIEVVRCTRTAQERYRIAAAIKGIKSK